MTPDLEVAYLSTECFSLQRIRLRHLISSTRTGGLRQSHGQALPLEVLHDVVETAALFSEKCVCRQTTPVERELAGVRRSPSEHPHASLVEPRCVRVHHEQ